MPFWPRKVSSALRAVFVLAVLLHALPEFAAVLGPEKLPASSGCLKYGPWYDFGLREGIDRLAGSSHPKWRMRESWTDG